MSTQKDETEQVPAPSSRFRHETLERYPLGHPKHEPIKTLAQRWVKTGEWRFRQKIGSAAGALIEDAEVVFGPKEEPDPWISAECAVDLAESCREYLKTYEGYVNA